MKHVMAKRFTGLWIADCAAPGAEETSPTRSVYLQTRKAAQKKHFARAPARLAGAVRVAAARGRVHHRRGRHRHAVLHRDVALSRGQERRALEVELPAAAGALAH